MVSGLIAEFGLKLISGFILAGLIVWHFKTFSTLRYARRDLILLLPFLLLSTVMGISLIETSLPLALGLVAVLSVLRFRTPIRETDELVYLYLTILAGLGVGANQLTLTTTGTVVILIGMSLFHSVKPKHQGQQLFLTMAWSESDQVLTEALQQCLSQYSPTADLKRFDKRDGMIEAIYLIQLADVQQINPLLDTLKSRYPQMGITFVDKNALMGNP